MLSADDPRRLIARLAAAVITADARITSAEVSAIGELDRLGLGRLSEVAREELLRAAEEPVDVGGTCEGLRAAGPQTAAIVLTVLARIALSDGRLSEREDAVLHGIAAGLGLSPADAGRVIDAARQPSPFIRSFAARTAELARRGVPERGAAAPAAACRLLGVEPGCSEDALEAAYLAVVERYDPAKVVPLGVDFVVLAVAKLAAATEAFQCVRGGAAGAAR